MPENPLSPALTGFGGLVCSEQLLEAKVPRGFGLTFPAQPPQALVTGPVDITNEDAQLDVPPGLGAEGRSDLLFLVT